MEARVGESINAGTRGVVVMVKVGVTMCENPTQARAPRERPSSKGSRLSTRQQNHLFAKDILNLPCFSFIRIVLHVHATVFTSLWRAFLRRSLHVTRSRLPSVLTTSYII